MKRLALPGALLLLAAPTLVGGDQPAPKPKTHEVTLNGHTFTLPEGFEIELAAGPPLVDRPIVADFDEQGRLYVADSSGSNEKVAVQLEKRPHRIVRLEDADGDGKFDRSTVFADKMMFPEGVMWRDGSLYVAAPPSIWKLTDTDGDGRADHRSEWFQGKTLTGCANDLHGPYAGPDGWVYWCKGAFAKQTYERPGARPFVTRAAHIFRARLDGSEIEPVMTGGMDNPVDVVFTRGGERIFTTTFFQYPGGGHRDGLIHAIYGGVYGKDHDVIYDHKWTGPTLMPVLTHLGPAAPAGLVRYESDAFGPDYRDNLFAACFNLQKVTRHVLTPKGATFVTRDEDFLVSSNRDFHPTDVIEDADGSLLVIDTGGWYKLCCPTSQLVKPDVLGGIYRIRKKGAAKPDDPRGLRLNWAKMSSAEMAGLLGDKRPAVRKRAVEMLGKRGSEATEAVAKVMRLGTTEDARLSAVWAATRIETTGARAAVRKALADTDETVRQAAIHSAGLRRDHLAVPALIELLKSPSHHNRRAAAEALGRIRDGSAIPPLLAAAAQPVDRALEHSIIYALIESGRGPGLGQGLQSSNPRIRRAALIAFHEVDPEDFAFGYLRQPLESADVAEREAARWIAGRHPEWGAAVANLLRQRLAAKDPPAAERDELTAQLAKLARSKDVQTLLAKWVSDNRLPVSGRRIVLQAMARSGLREAPGVWVGALTATLSGSDAELLSEAAAAARAVPPPKDLAADLAAVLRKAGADAALPAEARLTALSAVPGALSDVSPELFDFLRGHIDREQPVPVRSLAAQVLGRAKLKPDQLIALTGALKDTGPMELDRLLDAYAASTDEAVGLKLVAALKESPARSGLRLDALRQRLGKFGPKVGQQAEELYASLDADAPKQRAKLEQLLAEIGEGDVRRGQAVFNSPKASCSACHAVGYLGGTVGPDLTRIGRIRTKRDLLEAIAFPSASFVRGYEPVTVITKDGESHNGVLRKDAPDELLLATGVNQEVRVARADVEEVRPSKVSVMPAGLDQQLTTRELADLVAFLMACK